MGWTRRDLGTIRSRRLIEMGRTCPDSEQGEADPANMGSRMQDDVRRGATRVRERASRRSFTEGLVVGMVVVSFVVILHLARGTGLGFQDSPGPSRGVAIRLIRMATAGRYRSRMR